MKLNKRGFTLVELIVSIGLLSIVMVFMVNLFMETRIMFNDSKNITSFESDKRYLIKSLNSDLENNEIESITLTDNKVNIVYKNLGITKTLEIVNENGHNYLFYGCKSEGCNNEEKDISTYKKLLPDGSTIGSFSIKEATAESRLGYIKLPITISGKREDLSVYYSYKEVDTYDTYFFTDKLLSSVKNSNSDTTDTITIGDPISSSVEENICTNTLAFDGTSDNNLRYVGANPCNYIRINNLRARIIGVMNNVDNGQGKKETRIKVIFESGSNASWGDNNNFVNSNLFNKLGDNMNYNFNCYSNYISTATRYLRGIPQDKDNIKPNEVYDIEKTTGTVYGDNPTGATAMFAPPNLSDIVLAGGGDNRTSCLDMNLLLYATKTPTPTSNKKSNYKVKKLGVQNYSEYFENCRNDNWLNNGPLWTLMPTVYNETGIFTLFSNNIDMTSVTERLYNIPTAYLNADVEFTSGNGSYDNPYVLEGNNCYVTTVA